MNGVINYLWEFSLILIICWGFYKLVLEKLTFFELNRSFLIGTLLLALITPFLSFKFFNGPDIIREITLPTVFIGEAVDTSPGIWNLFNWTEALLAVYLVGFSVSFVHFLIGLVKSFLLLKSAKRIKTEKVTFAIHNQFQPASFFHYILLPEFKPNDSEQRQIILHESIHVEKKHSVDLLLVQIAKVVLWFNPVVYFFEQSLREVHEFQADQGVTQSYSSFDYSRLLVRLVSGQRSIQCIHHFSQFQTKKRIIMMNKKKSDQNQKGRFLMVIPLVAVLVFAFACEQELSDSSPVVIEETSDLQPNSDGTVTLDNSTSEEVIIEEISPASEVFDVVEQPPLPSGGMEGWIEYLTTNLEYPEQARKMGIEGMVMLSFIVNEDGSISNAEVLKGIGAGCDVEALRVINEAPNWQPGLQKGRNVKVRMRLPINFKLGSGEKGLSSLGLFEHKFAGFELAPNGIKPAQASIQPMVGQGTC